MSLIRFRIDLPNGHSVGPGKIELLDLVGRHASISAAARAMKMSYRQAWLKLESLNHALDEPVFETATGGAHGGGARLTPAGRKLIDRFRMLQSTIEKIARRELGPWVRHAAVGTSRSRARPARRPLPPRQANRTRPSKRRP
ncbi:MAG TPA: LysR family transcriptional regulator [Steroidobacteraceae bacterium]|nr:LysR family transcriptional regulator [Steroidobacteraceae bacterium]